MEQNGLNAQFNKLIIKRKTIPSYVDIDYDHNPIIQDMIELLTRNIVETIAFLDEECSSEQFLWMSEIFEEIATKTQSKPFIEALKRTAKKYPEITKEYNIASFIDDAENCIS